MITRIVAVAALLLFGFLASAAQGATAIAYSEPDNTYGWCAGYSTSEAPGCARKWCEESNGQDCKLALVCDAGWNSVAFADSDEAVGFGASCDMGSAYNARLTALASCIAHSRTVCWTDGTFNGEGNERSKAENNSFDLTWYVQGLLHGLGYDPGTTDGAFGNRTRAAIRAFQADMGIEQTGEVTEDLLYILLGKSGGIAFLVTTMEMLVETFTSDEKSRLFGAAHAPLADLTLSDELSFRNTAVQRVLLADYLRFNDRDCPMPAARTDRTDPEGGVWIVTCSNGGNFTVTLSADGKGDTIADNTQSPGTQVAQNDPPPAAAPAGSTGIAFSHSAPDDAWWVCTGAVPAAAECAQTSCSADGNGVACETVLTCEERGWSAAAVSPSALRGAGFSCGYASHYGAREVALAECLHETRAMCTLAVTVDPDGKAVSDDENAAFQRTYEAQAMLSIMGFYTDILSGEENQATRDAVTRLQTELGLETTGAIDDDLLKLAYYGALGKARYVMVMSRDIYDKMDPAAAAHHYGNSYLSAEEIRFSKELADLPERERLMAVAAAISAVDGASCTLPALGAEPDGADRWIVDCAEGRKALTFTGYDLSVTDIAGTTPPPTPAPPTSPPGKDKGGPAAPTAPTPTPSLGKTKG